MRAQDTLSSDRQNHMDIWYNLTLLGVGAVAGAATVLAVHCHLSARARQAAQSERSHRLAARFPAPFMHREARRLDVRPPRWTSRRRRDPRAE